MAIWSKGDDGTDALVHRFTVGDDWLRDRVLAPYDILGSIAQARMLGSVGLIPPADSAALVAGLRQLHREFLAGSWTVEASDEDVHSKVEAILTQRLGEPGKRLHTGRSRNDQVLTAIRLWLKDELAILAGMAATTAAALLERAQTHEFHPLPGYTHQQRAMPSSCGMFFGAHAGALIDDLRLMDAAWDLADTCPLGSSASYGVGLPIDRAMTARDLGFARSGAIAMQDANSRGKIELAAVDALGAVMADLSRLAADMVFFLSQEAGFFALGKGFTTGSSLMPQKRNPDLFELTRARANRFHGVRTGLAAITLGLPSGYNRDLQDTKTLAMEAVDLCKQTLAVATQAVPTIEPQTERIQAALTKDLYATDEACRLVRDQGMAFRDAYVQVGRNLDAVRIPDHAAVLKDRSHAGSTGNLGLPALGQRLTGLKHIWQGRSEALHAAWERLLTE